MDIIMKYLQEFFNTALIPAIVAGGAYLLKLITKYAKQYAKSLEVKHALEQMAKKTEIKTTLLAEIRTIVESVVSSNMRMADIMKKENGGHLNDDQSAEIKAKVEKLVMIALPDDLTEDGGVLLDIIGGKDCLNAIVSNMIDGTVYDYKLKKKSICMNK